MKKKEKMEKTKEAMKRKEKEPPLSGQAFVFTGVFKSAREDMTTRVRELGGRVTNNVSGLTSFLVAGTEPGASKMKKAADNKTSILSEQAFFEMVGGHEVLPAEVKKQKKEAQPTGNASKPARWTDKYEPKTVAEIVGNRKILEEIAEYIKNPHAKYARPLLLTGPAGVGKTLSVYVVAKEAGMTVIEYNGASKRGKAEIESIKEQTKQQSLSTHMELHRRKVLLLEEVDILGASDRGGVPEIASLLRESKIPVVLTATDRTDPKLKSLIPLCRSSTFYKPDTRAVAKCLKGIADKEGISIPDHVMIQIASQCAGDLRYGINILQCLTVKSEITTRDILALSKSPAEGGPFDTARAMFQPSITAARKYSAYYRDPDMATLMVFENHLEGGMQDIATTAEALSLADAIGRRIYYEGETSLFPAAAYNVAIRPKLKLSVRMEFPKYLAHNARKKKRKSELLRISMHMQLSGADPLSLIEILKVTLANPGVSADLKLKALESRGLDREDIEALVSICGTPITADDLFYTQRKRKKK